MDVYDAATANPFSFDYRNKAACLAYEKHLRELRELALDEPIRKGFQFELSLPSTQSTCPDARPSALFASQAPEVKCTLELCLRLSSRLTSRTQVWVADVQPLAGHGHDTIVLEPLETVQVVVKFLQPSMMSIPPVEELGHLDWEMQYTIPEEGAKDEAKIYKELSDVQGKLVPHFYGMHSVSHHCSPRCTLLHSVSLQVITPSGESAWALVLEYVKGVRLHHFVNDIFVDHDHPVDPQNFQRYCNIVSF
jgi:hypothetical protein